MHLHDLLPRGERLGNDELLGRFLEYTQARHRELYPAQEAAILELYDEKNVILNTPTGSGKSLVATALHFKRRSPRANAPSIPCPIKALVNEKFMALCRDFGPDNVVASQPTATQLSTTMRPSFAAPLKSSPTSRLRGGALQATVQRGRYG